MSVLRFAEEFSRLVMSYMKDIPPIKDSTKTVIVPLNNEQIAFTVHHVLRALGIKDGETNNNDDSSLSNLVSKTEIRYSIDSFSKVDLDEQEKENVYQDQSQLESQSESQPEPQPTIINNTSFSDATFKIDGIKTENSLENGLQSEKKYISRSNPALCVSVGRSDTFVCNEDHKTNTNIKENICQIPLNENILCFLEDLQKSVFDVAQKIDTLKKRALSTKQSGQLFTSSYLNFNHTMIKKEPIKIHRSMTTFSGSSSVSSKLQVTGKTDTLADRRKSTGGSSCGILTPRKSGSPKLDNSRSSLIESLSCNKLSPNFVPKLPKNPKYAHVKSTIPKPIPLVKKKAEAV